MKMCFKLLMLALGCMLSAKNYAQAGITGNSPDKSAILDINAPDKGLLISFVNLSSTTDVSGIAGQNPARGLLVYNNSISEIPGPNAVMPGYYFWEGGKWNKLATFGDMNNTAWSVNGNAGTSPSTNYVGTADNNDLRIKTNNIEQMRIQADGKVGIGVMTPGFLLETSSDTKFGGNLFLNKAVNAPLDNVSPLVRDNNTGQVYTISSSSGNTKPFSYVKYSITVNRDWLSNFNTNISINDYTVVVVGYALNEPDMYGMGMTYSGTFSSQQVYAFQSGSTWRLYADYTMGDTWPYTPAVHGTWDIYCLVINNSMLTSLQDQSFDLGGSDVGQATAAPDGL
ncbi:hypothetical protein QTN47_00010 [Danxiaibacter flavus]|uniref:Uncharacterized protein n=1 Tax=Danxiaibacter flavus TaxID=3049108 RepID=A0ABV3Z7L1_9BACT|nr:hypothetical protein QNM32_00010 [Chitinophagaceae bacterium DXS]